MKVLIADPDWHFAQQATDFLESHAHLVIRHSSARHAILQAFQWRPDLAIVSAELADSGILEALAAVEPAPAVLLTEHMERFDRAWRAWQRGGDELFLKPILKGGDLLEAVIGAMQNAAAGTRAHRTQVAASA
jgi:DNA-binding response OmpR family regulator